MQVSNLGGAGLTPTANAGSNTSSKASADADPLAEGFAALMSFGWLGESASTPLSLNAGSSGGDGPTAFDGEREVAQQDAQRRQPGGSRNVSQGEMTRRGAETKGATDSAAKTTTASTTNAAETATTAAKSQVDASAQAKTEGQAANAPLTPPPSMRQMRLQNQEADAAKAQRNAQVSAAKAAEKFSSAQKAAAAQGVNSNAQIAEDQVVAPVKASAGMPSASSSDRMMPNTTTQPTTARAENASGGNGSAAVAASESPDAARMVDRVNQIVNALAKTPQQQVVTQLSLEGGEQLGVVFRLRDAQLQVRFVTSNQELKGALSRDWERVQTNGRQNGLTISTPDFVDPTASNQLAS